jgi:hypothetical protein
MGGPVVFARTAVIARSVAGAGCPDYREGAATLSPSVPLATPHASRGDHLRESWRFCEAAIPDHLLQLSDPNFKPYRRDFR